MDVPRVVAGRFRVERELGRRAGVVTWLATDEAGGRPCTVKEFRLSEAPAAETLGIFEERARILAGLRLRGIPAFVAFSCGREGSDTVCRLVQEYVPGESLAARLAGRRRFGEEWVADWLGQAAEILAPLHRRSPPLLHRNLSPGNVIVGDDGKLHLIDFDFVTPLPADPRPLGFRLPWRSTSYAPPEADAGAWTPAADVFSLGAIAVTMLAGRQPPPQAGGAAGVAELLAGAGVGPPLARLVARMTDPDPKRRPRDADELLLELRAVRSVEGRRPRRARLPVRLALIAAAGILAAYGLPALVDQRPAERPGSRLAPVLAPVPPPRTGPAAASRPAPAAAPAPVAGAVVEGLLLFDGRPVTAVTGLAPRFWFRNETTGRVQEASATYSGGRYRVTGLPAGEIGMSVRIDFEPGNPWVYPGDLDAWKTLHVPEAGSLRADVPLRRIIRLRAPVDNNALTPGGEEECGRGNILASPVSFRWDPLGEGVDYAVRIDRMDCRRSYNSAGAAFETVTGATEVSVPLPPSPDGECYGFHLHARRGDTPVGMFTTHGTNYLAWDLRFAVRR